MILHCLNNFLPNHVAGIEVYVLNLCKLDVASNYVLITGKENLRYEIEGVKVFVIVEDNEFLKNVSKIISSINIDTIHYHLFEKGKLFEELTLIEFKKKNLKLVFTFHLVQYYCSTLRFKQNNLKNCTVVANADSCAKCYFETFYKPKYPKFLRNYFILNQFQLFVKVKNHFESSIQEVKSTLHSFEIIGNLFDELITINPAFYEKLNTHSHLKNKLKLISPDFAEIKKKEIKLNTIKLIFLGRIETSKGIDNLIDFAKKMKNENIEIDLYGQIYDQKYSIENFNSYSKSSKTKLNYKGALAPIEVLEVLKNYDYLIHPSQIAEMTPLVIKESFSVGLPVIGNDIFGINTYVINGINGWLLDFNNIKESVDFFNDLLSGKKKLGTHYAADE